MPPKLVACPADMPVESSSRWKKVFYSPLYDIFTDHSPITQITTNFRSGQYFQWYKLKSSATFRSLNFRGQYKIIITATDLHNNTATCQFLLTLYPEKGDGWQIPDSNTTFFNNHSVNKTDQIRDIGTVECINDDYVIAQDYAPFYVCDIMVWFCLKCLN